MLLIGQPAAALAGLFLVGLGVANGVPLMFSAAGRQPDTPPGPGHRRGLLDGLARLPRRAAGDRRARRRDLAAVGARDADPRRRRRVRARAPRDRADRAGARGSSSATRAASRLGRPCDDVRGGHLRPRRRAGRLVRRGQPRLGALGGAARHRRRRDPGGQPRPAEPRRSSPSTSPPELVDAEAACVLEAEIGDTRGVVAFPGAAAVLALPVVAIATSCDAAARPRAARRRRARRARRARHLRPGGARQAGAGSLPAGGRAARRRSRATASCWRTRRAGSRPAARRA